jgi:endonuclease YncB( thermonuclease family)
MRSASSPPRRRSRLRRTLGLLLLLLVLLGAGYFWFILSRPAPPDVVTLVRVSDGDTVVVRDSRGRQVKVRLVGVAAPELGTAASFRSALYCAELCEAAEELRLEPEPSRGVDKYGRVLGWLWLTDRRGREVLLNEELIRSGHAELYEGTSRKVKYWNRLR